MNADPDPRHCRSVMPLGTLSVADPGFYPGFEIRDPRSGIRKKPIPDPGSRGKKITGSRIRIRPQHWVHYLLLVPTVLSVEGYLWNDEFLFLPKERV